jgi:hypothetical protein
MMIVEEKIIIEVAAHLAGWQHVREQVQCDAGYGRNRCGQHGTLNRRRARHFLTMGAPLRDLFGQATKGMCKVG